jgi:hypothetical protein
LPMHIVRSESRQQRRVSRLIRARAASLGLVVSLGFLLIKHFAMFRTPTVRPGRVRLTRVAIIDAQDAVDLLSVSLERILGTESSDTPDALQAFAGQS